MKKSLTLLFIFITQLALCMNSQETRSMDVEQSQHSGIKRKAESDVEGSSSSSEESEDSDRATSTKKQKVEMKSFDPCRQKYLHDDSICGQQLFSSDGTEMRHRLYEQHIARNKQCPGCKRKFTFVAALIKHLSKCESIDARDLLQKIEKADIPQRCSGCRKIFTFTTRMKQHIKQCKNFQAQSPALPDAASSSDPNLAEQDSQQLDVASSSGAKSSIPASSAFDTVEVPLDKPQAHGHTCNLQFIDTGDTCNKKFDFSRGLTIHKLYQHITEDFTECLFCTEQFRNFSEYIDHLRKCIEGGQSLAQEIDNLPLDQRCSNCNKIFEDGQMLFQHVKECGASLVCNLKYEEDDSICNTRCEDVNQLRNHKKKQHVSRAFKCPFCHRSFPKYFTKYQEHLGVCCEDSKKLLEKIKNSQPKQMCQNCGLICCDMQGLTKHKPKCKGKSIDPNKAQVRSAQEMHTTSLVELPASLKLRRTGRMASPAVAAAIGAGIIQPPVSVEFTVPATPQTPALLDFITPATPSVPSTPAAQASLAYYLNTEDNIIDNLVEAASQGDLEKVKEFLKYIFNINAKGKSGLSALEAALQNGKQEVANFLLSESKKLADIGIN